MLWEREYEVTYIAEGLVELTQVNPPNDVRDIPLIKLLAYYRPVKIPQPDWDKIRTPEQVRQDMHNKLFSKKRKKPCQKK